jgi:hypothetical protein
MSARGMDFLELQTYFVVISTFNKILHTGSSFVEPAAPIDCQSSIVLARERPLPERGRHEGVSREGTPSFDLGVWLAS